MSAPRPIIVAAAIVATLTISGCIEPEKETQGIAPPSSPPTTTVTGGAQVPPAEPATNAPPADATDGSDVGDTPEDTNAAPAGITVSLPQARRSPTAAARRYAELEGNYVPKTFQAHREQLRQLATGGLRTTLGYAPRTDRIAQTSRTEVLSVASAEDQRAAGQRTVYVVAQTTVGRSADVDYRTIRVRLTDGPKGWAVSSWTELSGS